MSPLMATPSVYMSHSSFLLLTNEDICVGVERLFTFPVLHMFRHKKRVTGTRAGLSCYVIVIVICYSNIIVFVMKRGWRKLLLLFYCYFLFHREKIDRS